jgi:antitoxin (DNA-binding transcriptional repressor) of toxin-antitoxin stability system
VNSVKIADLKNNLSRHLVRVRRGAEITVLDRDTPVARIVPFVHGERAAGRGAAASEAADRVADLVRQGVLSPADGDGIGAWLGAHRAVKLPDGAPSAVEILVDARRESRR